MLSRAWAARIREIFSTNSFKKAIHENLDPRNISAIRNSFKVHFFHGRSVIMHMSFIDVFMANLMKLQPIRHVQCSTRRDKNFHILTFCEFSQACNELCTHETYHHDPQPLPVNIITIT